MATYLRQLILVILMVLVTGILATGQTSQAPQTSAPEQGSAMGAQTAGSPEMHLQMLSEKLNLSDDQKAKLKPLLTDEAQQMRAVRDDSSLSQEQKRAKMKSIHESFQPQINGVLTPEQQAKWKQMKEEAKEHYKGSKERDSEHE
ncbi:MAG TPA: hypothetical protein VEG30_16525 [Terriglobales bacterium]|nr:hypothetical protein [Terriglobales bacterium]